MPRQTGRVERRGLAHRGKRRDFEPGWGRAGHRRSVPGQVEQAALGIRRGLVQTEAPVASMRGERIGFARQPRAALGLAKSVPAGSHETKKPPQCGRLQRGTGQARQVEPERRAQRVKRGDFPSGQ